MTKKKFTDGTISFVATQCRWAPDFMYHSAIWQKAEIDGTQIEFFVNSRTWGSNVYFEHNDSVYYTSCKSLADRVKRPSSYLVDDGAAQDCWRFTEIEYTPRARPERNYLIDRGRFYKGPARDLLGNSPLMSSEENDCTVKALAVAMEISYDDAHAQLSKWRKPRKGLGFIGVLNAHYKEDFVKLEVKRGITLRTFLRVMADPKERYIITVSSHALSVVDGMLVDHSVKLGRRIISVYRRIK